MQVSRRTVRDYLARRRHRARVRAAADRIMLAHAGAFERLGR